MTEEEARKKWCPFARGLYGDLSGGSIAVNRPHVPDAFPDHCCIASDCMAWRIKLLGVGDRPDQGFCGLAGR